MEYGFEKKFTRREFLKTISYLILSLPILSFIIPRWLKSRNSRHIKPRDAKFYRHLAG